MRCVFSGFPNHVFNAGRSPCHRFAHDTLTLQSCFSSLREQFLFVYNAPIVVPLIRIAWIIGIGLLLMKVVDSALKRLRLLVHNGDGLGATGSSSGRRLFAISFAALQRSCFS